MANCDSLYTDDELIAAIKEIDLSLLDATTKADLDTGQSKQSWAQSLRTLREQREYYIALLQKQNPCVYKATFGPSVIRFGGRTCN